MFDKIKASKKQNYNRRLGSISGPHVPPKIRAKMWTEEDGGQTQGGSGFLVTRTRSMLEPQRAHYSCNYQPQGSWTKENHYNVHECIYCNTHIHTEPFLNNNKDNSWPSLIKPQAITIPSVQCFQMLHWIGGVLVFASPRVASELHVVLLYKHHMGVRPIPIQLRIGCCVGLGPISFKGTWSQATPCKYTYMLCMHVYVVRSIDE